MCLSATVSFTASGLLAAGGLYTLKVKNVKKDTVLLASMPLIFAVHQFSEGIVWLGLTDNKIAVAYDLALYLYCMIAFVLWPVYVPVLMLFLEKNKRYRQGMKNLLVLGTCVSTYLFWCFAVHSQVVPYIAEDRQAIEYLFDVPYLRNALDYLYLMASITPFFLTSQTKLRWIIGPIWAATFPIAKYVASDTTFPSIWCFMAAVVSLIIYVGLEDKEPPNIEIGQSN